jgi:hypothetical protein
MAAGLALAAALAPAGQASAASAGCTTSGSKVTCVFLEAGSAQTWTVPPGITKATFTLYGAQGGHGDFSGAPGVGAKVAATLRVTAGTMLQVNVGQAGASNGHSQTFGGGGSGSTSGGGASDIRTPASDGTYPVLNRLLVAGGGGGAGEGSSPDFSLGASGGNANSAGGTGPSQYYQGVTLGGGTGGSEIGSVRGGTVTGSYGCGVFGGFTHAGSDGLPSSGLGIGGDAPVGEGAGGGGGGYYGGGGGGGQAVAFCPDPNNGRQLEASSGGGGGAGGTSYTGFVASASVTNGVAAPNDAPNGEVIISYTLVGHGHGH